MPEKKKKKKKKGFADFLRQFAPKRNTNKNADKLLKQIDSETMASGGPSGHDYDQTATRKRRYTARM